MAKTADEVLYDMEVVRPLVLQLLDEGLVLVESPHEDGKKPHHRFYMSKTTVSQALWKALMGANPSVYPWDDPNESKRYPVDDVFLEDCLAFIRILNDRPEVRERRLEFQLPQRAKWRFASRAGGKSYQSGKHVCAKKGIRFEEAAWYKGNPSHFPVTLPDPDLEAKVVSPYVPPILKIGADGLKKEDGDEDQTGIPGPRPMGILKENGFHLHDIFGNLWEWTLEDNATQGELWGGSWADGPEDCTWLPRKELPKRGDGVTGLRLVAVRKAGRHPAAGGKSGA